MMAESKGRGGKKPKYQIADIGGPDLTSEDISTERVLNFLIRGEAAPAEQNGPPDAENATGADAGGGQSHASAMAESAAPADEAPTRPVKKSLEHLFQRANSGSAAGPAKDLKLDLSEPEPAVPPPPPPRQAAPTEEIKGERDETSSAAPEVTAQPVAAPAGPAADTSLPASPPIASEDAPGPAPREALTTRIPPPEPAAPGFDLAPYVELWKNFYRLKAGEIEALSTLFRMTHGEGRVEAHVKMRKLAEMSSLDYRYCQKVVRSLERLGWITKLQDYDPATQLGVLYRVNLKPAQAI